VKRFYCFYCQKNIDPFKLFKWKFCPDCKHYISDTGDGFYKVCDRCGANLPTDAADCIKCGYAFHGDNALKEYNAIPLSRKWFEGFVSVLILFLSVLIGLGVIYLSFYAILFIFVVGFVWFFLNMLRIRAGK